jgi:hypothetical protein
VTKEQMLQRIDQIVSRCDGNYTSRIPPDEAFNGALTLMIDAYGHDSEHVAILLKRRDEIASGRKTDVIRWVEITNVVKGMLENLHREVEDDLLTSLERRVESDVLSDLVQLARAVLEAPGDGPKNVAAVLTAAAYEDTLRRIAREHAGVIGRDDLSDVVLQLKNAGLLVSPQLGIVQSFLNFRNRALHAEWDQIDRTSVGSGLTLVQELLLKHFG